VGGGKGPNVFDCSGFVYWCLNQVGVKQSYMTSKTWRSCSKYTRIESMGDLQRGDVIVYKGHVAICAGDGIMIDASSGNHQVVKRQYVGSSYWKRYFICGYRIF
jgi:cell wall-associated NlpC family hydrolase